MRCGEEKAMRVILQHLRNVWKEVKRRKVRLAIAVLVATCLFVISTHYLYSGINKRLLVYTVLSLGVGVFLACPRLKKWYLSCLCVIGYLCFVPRKMFQRMELPVHDMSRIQGGGTACERLDYLLSLRAGSAGHTACGNGAGRWRNHPFDSLFNQLLSQPIQGKLSVC